MSHGEREFLKIAIVGGKKGANNLEDNISPCGVCLQYMLDICPDVEIISYINGNIESKKLVDYLNRPYKLVE